jgi:hypothetical protein
MARRRGIEEYSDLQIVGFDYQSFTPNIDILSGSGSVTGSTVNHALYTQIGDLVHGFFRIGVTLSGTDVTTALRIDTPVTAYNTGSAFAMVGGGYWYNGSVAFEINCYLGNPFTEIRVFAGDYGEVLNAGTRTVWGNFTYRAA